MTNRTATTEQRITITAQDTDGTPHEHVYIIDNRKQGIELVEELRRKGVFVARYVFSPLF